MALTDKKLVFANEYLVDLNATQAAKRAQYSYPNKQGPRLLQDPDVHAYIDEQLEQRALGRNEVLARLSAQATADLSPYMSSNNFGKIVLDLGAVKEAGLGHLIKKVTNTKDGSSIEFHDSQAALVHLGRYHALFTDKTDVTSGGKPLKPTVFLPAVDNLNDDGSAD